MGFLDRFKRQDDSDAFQDPSKMDPMNWTLDKLEQGLRRPNGSGDGG